MSIKNYFNKSEKILWLSSIFLITVSFLIFDRENYVTLAASIIGATSLIFIAKGNPIGQILTIIFSIIYGVISYKCAYYGEMLTYVGMTAPMAVIVLVFWLKNPYNGNRAEVRVNHIKRSEVGFMFTLTAAVTAIFYFILRYFNTANLIPSTISVTTSFIAVYLSFRRSPYYALGYAANDVVLIVLWTLATIEDRSYLSVIICFVMFLFNDIYGFYNWNAMHKRQNT